jgi:hypothetical protein
MLPSSELKDSSTIPTIPQVQIITIPTIPPIQTVNGSTSQLIQTDTI